MKKAIFLLTFMAFVGGLLNAQVNRKAFGLRLGYDAQEFSYQQPLGKANRLELTLGGNTFGRNQAGNPCRGAGLNGIYQWIHNLTSIGNSFSWYYGLGAAVLDHGHLFGIGALAQVGVAYNFNSPLQLSLDYRPGMYYLPGAGNIYRFSWNVPCIGIRYFF
jgi:hypothetical protein